MLLKKREELEIEQKKLADAEAAAKRQAAIDAAQIDCSSTGRTLAQTALNALGLGKFTSFNSKQVVGNKKACDIGFQYKKIYDTNLARFNHYPGKAVKGYSYKHLTGVTREQCADECSTFTKYGYPCQSFDYNNGTQECDLSTGIRPAAALPSDSLYDHYSIKDTELQYRRFSYNFDPDTDSWALGTVGEVGSGDAIKGLLPESHVNSNVSIKSADGTYLNADGRIAGETLIKNSDSVTDNGKWVIQPTGTSGAYNIKMHDSNLYVNSRGGHSYGNHQQLNSTPDNYSTWNFERSTTMPGYYYIKAHGSPYHAALSGGSGTGRQLSISGCGKGYNLSRCQWKLESV